MKKISLWAKHHAWPARIIIVISSLALIALGIITGMLLRDIAVDLPWLCFLFFSLLYAAGLVFYPGKKNRTYRRQKTCDLLLVGAGFLMIVYLGNHPQNILNFSTSFTPAIAATTSFPKDSSVKNFKPIPGFAASMKDENGKLLKWKERKKMLKEQVRAIKKSKEISDVGKVALIVLSVIVAMGLIVGIGALACSISCGGGPAALSWIVLLGGTILVSFLLVFVIRKILGKKKKDIKNPKQDPGSK